MKVSIIEKSENPVLGREDIRFMVEGLKKTPTRAELRKKIAALTNAKEEGLVVDSLESNFGSHVFFGTARVYRSGEGLKRIELKHKIAKNFGKEKEGNGAEAAPKAEGTESTAEEAAGEEAKEKGAAGAKEDEVAEKKFGKEHGK